MTHIKVLNNVLICMTGDFFSHLQILNPQLSISQDFLFFPLS